MRILGLLFLALALSTLSGRAQQAPPSARLAPSAPTTYHAAPVASPDYSSITVEETQTATTTAPVSVSSQSVLVAPANQAHYTINDLARSIRTLGPDRSDPNHHTISEVGL